MLSSSITLAMDLDFDGDVDLTEAYTRYDDQAVNRTTYIGPDHSLVSRQQIQFYRTFPKRSGNSFGVAKAAEKVTFDIVVPGVDGVNQTVPLIAELSWSIPVGAETASLRKARSVLVEILQNNTVMDSHLGLLEI